MAPRQESTANSPDLPRRALLKVSVILSGVLTLGGLLKFLGYRSTPATPTRFILKPVREYPIGSVTSVPEARVWLVRDEAGLFAVSAICTHLGCTVGQAEPRFECPCHGSRFYPAGKVVRGPAREPLKHVELTLSPEGLVVLDTAISVSATERL